MCVCTLDLTSCVVRGVPRQTPLRTLYNTYKLGNTTLASKVENLWDRDLPDIITAFDRLDNDYIDKPILDQVYVDRLLTTVDNGLAKA